MDSWPELVTAVKTTKLSSGRVCLSHHLSKGCAGGPVASLESIGFWQLRASPGNEAGGALNLQFPALFASPAVDQQTFDCKGG